MLRARVGRRRYLLALSALASILSPLLLLLFSPSSPLHIDELCGVVVLLSRASLVWLIGYLASRPRQPSSVRGRKTSRTAYFHLQSTSISCSTLLFFALYSGISTLAARDRAICSRWSHDTNAALPLSPRPCARLSSYVPDEFPTSLVDLCVICVSGISANLTHQLSLLPSPSCPRETLLPPPRTMLSRLDAIVTSPAVLQDPPPPT